MTQFIKTFNPADAAHVEWLGKMIETADKMADPTNKSTLIEDINKNPMGIQLTPMEALDWPHIHFCLCGLYTKALFKGTATLPSR